VAVLGIIIANTLHRLIGARHEAMCFQFVAAVIGQGRLFLI
jgi:hypothetical protein